jgi:transposase
MRRIKLATHLSIEEIEARYRGASDGVGRSQWHIVWLLAQGKPSREGAAVTGYGLDWIRALARRYHAKGPSGIGDGRHTKSGRPSPLSQVQQQRLKQEILAAQARGESWKGRQVAQWMSEQLGRPIYMQRGYEWLAKLGFSPQMPRPAHKNADVEDQAVFKKSSRKP